MAEGYTERKPLPEDFKLLYIQWLKNEIENINPKQERLIMVYSKALESLKAYKSTLRYPESLLAVKCIGHSIKNKLEIRFLNYCRENGYPLLDKTSEETLNDGIKICIRKLQDDPSLNKPKKKRKYVPKKRSGGYAILLALLECYTINNGISKEDIIELASKYCDSNFASNPSTKEFYSAWNSMKTLIDNNLVIEEGRPRQYMLTEEGQTLAESLKIADNIYFQPESRYHKQKFQDDNSQLIAFKNNELSKNLSDLMNSNEVQVELPNSSSWFANNTFPDISLDIGNQNAFMVSSLLPPKSSEQEKPIVEPINTELIRARWNGIIYELWVPDSYDIILFIDHREVRSLNERSFFVEALQKRGIRAEVKQLSLGDMVWVARHKITKKECVLNFLLERKRLDDLSSSIKDNRFIEQKNRLKKTGCKYIFYLIEETSRNGTTLMAQALKTSIWTTAIYNNFHIKRTKNSDDTVEWLYNISHSIYKYYSGKMILVIRPRDLSDQSHYQSILDKFRVQFEKRNNKIECSHSYESFQEISEKNTLMTVKELYIRTLMLTRGVSLEKALVIQLKYPTLKSLLLAYQHCKSDNESKRMMQNAFSDQPGNKRIGKALSETLWETFGK